MSAQGHNSGGQQLRAFIERIERAEEEIKALNADKSEIYKEARGNGFDVKTMRKVVAARKMDVADREEADALFEMYMAALGDLPKEQPSRVHVHVREGVGLAGPASEGQGRSLPANIKPAPIPDEPVAATETAGDYLREPAAVVSGQIIREGDAPRETGHQASEQSPGDGDASSPDTDFTPPTFLAKKVVLRPDCLDPEKCAGYGSHQCHRCTAAAAPSDMRAAS